MLLHWRRCSITICTWGGWQGWCHWQRRQRWRWWWCKKRLLRADRGTPRTRWCIHHGQHGCHCTRSQSLTGLANALQRTVSIKTCGPLSMRKFARYLSPCQALGNTFTNDRILVFGKSVTWFSIATIVVTAVLHIGHKIGVMARIVVVPLGW